MSRIETIGEQAVEPIGGEVTLTDVLHAELDADEAADGMGEELQKAVQIDADWKRRWVIQREGKDFVLYAGLVDLLHQVSGGDFTIMTKLEQAPSDANGLTAIVSATASIGRPGGPGVDRMASGLGDANPGNVNRMMQPHLIRLAETRAKGRCLRDLLNIGLVTVEELGPPVPPAPVPGTARNTNRPAAPAAATAPQPSNQRPATGGFPDGIVVEGTRFTRKQVWDAFNQRMNQCQDGGLNDFMEHMGLKEDNSLPQLVAATQKMKRALAAAGKLPQRNGAAG